MRDPETSPTNAEFTFAFDRAPQEIRDRYLRAAMEFRSAYRQRSSVRTLQALAQVYERTRNAVMEYAK